MERPIGNPGRTRPVWPVAKGKDPVAGKRRSKCNRLIKPFRRPGRESRRGRGIFHLRAAVPVARILSTSVPGYAELDQQSGLAGKSFANAMRVFFSGKARIITPKSLKTKNFSVKVD